MQSLPTDIKWLLSLDGAPARQFGSLGIYTSKSPTIITWSHSNVLRWRWLPARYVAMKVNANNYMSKENELYFKTTTMVFRGLTNYRGPTI